MEYLKKEKYCCLLLGLLKSQGKTSEMEKLSSIRRDVLANVVFLPFSHEEIHEENNGIRLGYLPLSGK